MITPKETQHKPSYWGVCQGCLKERKFSAKTGTMLPHRKWVKTPDGNGTMVPCEGSGYRPVAVQNQEGNQNG